ncbi:MAG TPA: hypothetical protein VKA60_01640 [Blastocatellia bacterium]|nr:hypothetical protein [Blastocatellia bacterium]
MTETTVQSRVRLARLILIPGLIALAVTLLRLFGELRHWSPRWFDPEPSGITPSGVGWVIGISWLALPFGVYFAMRLVAAGEKPPSAARAVAYALLGLLILYLGQRVIVPRLGLGLRSTLLLIWAFSVVPALLQYQAWPAMWRVLLAYGLVSRIPVAIIMFMAMRGNWGTHYDYGAQVPPAELWFYYIWLGLVPQLVFWVGYTILVGMLAGALTAAFCRRRRTSVDDSALTATG